MMRRSGTANQQYRARDVELSLDDMQRSGATRPTCSFRIEDLPVGHYRVQLPPILMNWMIELPGAGRDDVELIVPALAELWVETVDKSSGERIPVEETLIP